MKLNKLFLTLTMLSVFTMFNANANPVETKTTEQTAQPKIEKQFKHHKHHKKHRFAHKKGNQLDKILNLTQEQKDILKQNREESIKKMKPIMKKMSKNKYEIDKIMLSDLPKAKKIEKVEKIKTEMKALKVQADEIRKDDMKKFESVLTDEQKVKFEEFKKEKRKQFEQRKPVHPIEQ